MLVGGGLLEGVVQKFGGGFGLFSGIESAVDDGHEALTGCGRTGPGGGWVVEFGRLGVDG